MKKEKSIDNNDAIYEIHSDMKKDIEDINRKLDSMTATMTECINMNKDISEITANNYKLITAVVSQNDNLFKGLRRRVSVSTKFLYIGIALSILLLILVVDMILNISSII